MKERISLKRKYDARDGPEAEDDTEQGDRRPAGLDHKVPFSVEEKLAPSLPEKHYQMSNSTKNKINMLRWLESNQDDPALIVSIPC